MKSTRTMRSERLESRMMLAGDAMSLSESCAASLTSEDGAATYRVGDANYDGTFDQLDIQAVLQAGKYRTNEPADWSEGDWNGDERFDQLDLILALQSWPNQIFIPKGFEAEGIELGKGHDFFVGAFSYSGDLTQAGSVYKGNLCTGEGAVLVQQKGRLLSGLSYDERTDYLYAGIKDPGVFEGNFTNQGVAILDGTSGELVQEIIFGDGIEINDALVTSDAVYLTDSLNPALYKVPLDGNGQPSAAWEKIELSDFVMDYTGLGFNANGLVGDFDGKELVVVNVTTGVLYKIDTESGASTPIEIDGDEGLFPDGDGLVMDGRRLYIMQNFAQKIAVVELSDDLSRGTFVENLVSDKFAIPTTIIGFEDHIYAVNTDFCERTALCGLENPDTAQVRSAVVRVDKSHTAVDNVSSQFWPDQISLPVGFEPKDIEVGKGHDFFVGAYSWSSLLAPNVDLEHPVSGLAGAIYKGNLRTGVGDLLVPPQPDNPRPVLGLSYDARTDYLYAAVGDPATLSSFPNQGIAVYNGSTGELVDEIIIGDGIFLSNVLVTESAVFATTTTEGVLFKLPLGNDGNLPSPPAFERIDLAGFEPANEFYAWGIDGDDQDLLVLNGLNGSGVLYHVDPATGVSTPIPIHGDQQTFDLGDELYISGRTLYIMQVFANSIAVVQLSDDLTEGTFVKTIDCGECRSPHNIAGFGNSIYVVNTHALFDPDNAAEDIIFGDPAQVQSEVVKLPKIVS